MDNNLQTKRKSQMSDNERVRDFQRKLYQKAKQEPDFRFYVLYDKVRLPHFLREAYRRCKAKDGSPGVDGMRFEDVEENGKEKFLKEIIEKLKNRTYKPQPVLRVLIPKSNGKLRPLGIPVIEDRVIQMVVKLVIEPIFEADFEESSYGFRPKQSAKDAISEIKQNLKQEKVDIFDADLSNYFDTIPHKELLKLIGMRISDKNIIHLIKMWLKAPIMKDNRPIGGKKNKIGIPQGGVISPLLANIYLNLIDKAVNREDGAFCRFGIKIVRYADDFILMANKIPEESMKYLCQLLEMMKLKLNMEKSRSLYAKEDNFDFLGFTFGYKRDIFGRKGMKYWCIEPSKKSQKNVRQKVKEYIGKNGHKNSEKFVVGLNRIIRGWLNYFQIDGVSYSSKAKKNLKHYLNGKLVKFFKRKSQRRCKLYNQGALRVMIDKYGLIDPTKYTLC